MSLRGGGLINWPSNTSILSKYSEANRGEEI